jgi:agmatine deiminase
MKQKLYFSALLDGHPNYGKDFEKIKAILQRYKIEYGLIEGTKDIWARDYMPVTNAKDELVQFIYEPSYLQDDLHLQTNPDDILIDGKVASKHVINLKLDGGNYIQRGNKVIICDRIFSENNIEDTGRSENLRKVFNAPFGIKQQQFINKLEKLLGLEIIIIPSYPAHKDMTGHSDGYIRFVHDHVVLISQLDKEEQWFADKMLATLKRHELEFIEMPVFENKDYKHPDSAIGCYLNYLELDDLIIFPIFDKFPALDNEALAVMKKHFSSKRIVPIVINDIANSGGLMNCISWVN